MTRSRTFLLDAVTFLLGAAALAVAVACGGAEDLRLGRAADAPAGCCPHHTVPREVRRAGEAPLDAPLLRNWMRFLRRE